MKLKWCDTLQVFENKLKWRGVQQTSPVTLFGFNILKGPYVMQHEYCFRWHALNQLLTSMTEYLQSYSRFSFLTFVVWCPSLRYVPETTQTEHLLPLQVYIIVLIFNNVYLIMVPFAYQTFTSMEKNLQNLCCQKRPFLMLLLNQLLHSKSITLH